MNATAREGIFIPCCVYIPAEPPLMGLESLKMCFSRPGKLLAGRMCRDLCIFDAAWGGYMTYLESRGIQTTRHATKREKSFSQFVYVCVRKMYAKCALAHVLLCLLVFLYEGSDTTCTCNKFKCFLSFPSFFLFTLH